MSGALFEALRKQLASNLTGIWLHSKYHYLRAVALKFIPDATFARWTYWRCTGGQLNLSNPTTFDEKQWWLKLNYRDPLMTLCTDKFTVRKYVEECGLGHILHPLVASYASTSEIVWSELPDSFYLKTNNSSATNIRCDDLSQFDTRRASRLLDLYLKKDHFALSREWNYRDIKPRILVEPVITIPGGSLIDYRFLCSHGECKAVFIDLDTADDMGGHRTDARRNVYDPQFRLLDVTVSRPRIMDRPVERPATFDRMREYAEILSAPFPFCRVDMYSVEERIIFGEITFFHAGGCNRMEPPEYQYLMGEWIDLVGIIGRQSESES